VLSTAFTELVGCQVPIQLAGMPQVSVPRLAAAVADAGGLGMITPTDDTVEILEQLANETSGKFGINFLIPFLDLEAVEAAAGRARVVDFHFGDPDASLVARVHQGGALAGWQVGSAD
jgi:nitronate monooxygenase